MITHIWQKLHLVQEPIGDAAAKKEKLQSQGNNTREQNYKNVEKTTSLSRSSKHQLKIFKISSLRM